MARSGLVEEPMTAIVPFILTERYEDLVARAPGPEELVPEHSVAAKDQDPHVCSFPRGRASL